MPRFAELMHECNAKWQRTIGGNMLYEEYTDANRRVSEAAADFFDRHAFCNLETLGQGSSAVILKDMDNPALVFRIAPSYAFDTRAIIPQVLQPIHVETIGPLKIELLPNISVPDALPDQEFINLLNRFEEEVRQSGHRMASDSPQYDVGLFRYEDMKKPGNFKHALLAADASLIPPRDGVPPACGADFPTLQEQYREQCRIVQQDPRLQQLLGGLPATLPATKVISFEGRRI